ncbi:MAG TPA: HIT family protein [Hyphomicrobiales bacterium]|nr:HIT family protein [Hyphomicrobiales bacterium]
MPLSDGFVLNPRFAANTAPVCDLALSRVLLTDDSRFPWLLLVPRRADVIEIGDLAESDRAVLIEEIALASAALRATVPCDRINVGALANNTPQLHVHVVARTEGDAAWPGPVWGVPNAVPYGHAREERIAMFRRALGKRA